MSAPEMDGKRFVNPTEARDVGEYMGKLAARTWFNQRGNHYETHVTEAQLAGIIAKAVELAVAYPRQLSRKASLARIIEAQRAAQHGG